MAFKDFPNQQQGVQLLQRSLERKRLAHAYLLTGQQIDPLEGLAATLARTLNCEKPLRRNGVPVDCCDQCLACQKIQHGNHPDVHWVRPESKTRIITIAQMRRLMKQIQLKPTEAEFKAGIIVCADRMNTDAASAFLKTLEEPPDRSVLILLSTEPQRLLETILSRCLRLNFGGEAFVQLSPEQSKWLANFSQMAAAGHKSLIGRYRLMDVLLGRLSEMKTRIEETLTARSPLQQYKDVEKEVIEAWEAELSAAIEAEYRRQRSELLAVLQFWLRDVWVQCTLHGASNQIQASAAPKPSAKEGDGQLLNFPHLDSTNRLAERISPADATENLEVMEQLQRWLYTNVQEALALEVGLLKLRL